MDADSGRSMNKYNELNVEIDLDAESGRTGRSSNVFRLLVRPTRVVNLAMINGWLQGQAAMDETVLESFSEFVLCLWL